MCHCVVHVCVHVREAGLSGRSQDGAEWECE